MAMFLVLSVLYCFGLVPDLAALNRRTPKAAASAIQVLRNLGKESFIRTFDKDVDFAGAAKSSSRIETHKCWFAGSQNLAGASRHFFLDASGAQRTDRCSIFANQ